MHEMSLMRNVLEVVLDECQGQDVAAVKAVHLSIGEASDVIEDQIEPFFRFLAKDTVAENARIVITRIPIMVRCKACSNIFQVNLHDESSWLCPRCQKKDYRLFSGREFRIDNIEVEMRSDNASSEERMSNE